MSFFTSTDAADASTFLRSVNQADGSFSEHFLMPITSFENNGQPVIPKGFGDKLRSVPHDRRERQGDRL